MASLNYCIYAMYIVMIIAWNNVHLFQQQSDKLYLCCTFGLLAWTLLSNISQLGLLLRHKPYKLLSTYQCFLDVVLFQSTTKGHFFSLCSSTLLLFSCPSSCWPKKTKDFKLHFLHALCKHCESEALWRLAQETAFHHPAGEDAPQTPAKHTGNLITTYRPQELPGGLADHLGMSLYKSDRQALLYCTHMTASLSFQGCCVFYGQPAAEILMLLLYFRGRKKA